VAFLCSCFLNLSFYFNHTKPMPTFGGVYREGLIGQPRFITPPYLSNQDIDRDLTELIFSGLMKYSPSGTIIEDLASNYVVKEDSNVYEVFLKKDLFWHDGQPLTADDVLFTINLIQDPQYQSPLRLKWSGIAVEKIEGEGIRFRLPQKYSGFLENLTIKIVPKHIFENISPQNMPWTLSPKYLVGSGPFQLKEARQDKTGYIKKLILSRNEQYFGQKPYLKELNLIFYNDEAELLRKAGSGDIDGFSLADPQYFTSNHYNFTSHTILMPRYFALFFNLRNQDIWGKQIREALAVSIDKDKLLQNIFMGQGEKASSPILPAFFGLQQASSSYAFEPQKSQELLDQAGYLLNTSSQKREKLITEKVAPLFTKELKPNDKGEDVKKLQECLAKDPVIYSGPIDGVFSKQVTAALVKFQEKYASEILIPEKLKKGNGLFKERTRAKLNELCQVKPQTSVPLKITITTSDKFPLSQIADFLKQGWEKIGLTVEVQKVSLADLQTNVLAKSSFEVLLFGEALGAVPDPFPFWHSSQKDYPGLNVAGYNSKEADKALEKIRTAQTEKDAKESLEKFQGLFLNDLPAIFLVQPDYAYLLSPMVRGFNTSKITEPAKRFSGIENWYVKTKRVWQ
jgi:ABC-type transport system substrate-binding protein